VVQWRLGPELKTAGQVRREAVRWLAEQGIGPLDDTAVVLAELLANAVHAARGTVSLDVDVMDGNVLISVTDDGPGFGDPPPTTLPPVEAEGSRGLYLVRALSEDFAVARTRDGTTVRCSLHVGSLAG
jgi:anti-sigma regulatory factor (Ser/Thr protein kinase)